MMEDLEDVVAAWAEERIALKKRLVTVDAHPYVCGGAFNDPATMFNGAPLTLVAGVDVSYVKNANAKTKTYTTTDQAPAPAGAAAAAAPDAREGATAETETEETAVACLTVLSFPSLECLHVDFEPAQMTTPYVAGFLAFRELPPLLRLLRRCPPEYKPAVVFVDGNGVLHPVGLYKLNPILNHSLKPPGINPQAYKVKNRFQSLCFQTQLVPLQPDGVRARLAPGRRGWDTDRRRGQEPAPRGWPSDEGNPRRVRRRRSLRPPLGRIGSLSSKATAAAAMSDAERVASRRRRQNADAMRGGGGCGGAALPLIGKSGALWGAALYGHGRGGGAELFRQAPG